MSIPDNLELLLALEGGGTRSQAALLDRRGQVLTVAPAADVNTNFTPYAQAQAAVRSAVATALQQAGRDGEEVAHVARALVGPRFGPETLGDLLPNARYHDYTERDVVFARAGLDASQAHGVALVAATGATAFARRADDGRQVSLGGWGSLLGDEGSAYALGLLALRTAARAAEGRAPAPTGLVQALTEHFSIDPQHFKGGLIQVAYGSADRPALTRAQIGSLAPLVTGLAAGGDVLAGRLVDKVAADLAALALHAARRLFCGQDAFDVVVSGGLVNGGERVLAPLRAGLAVEFPLAVLRLGSLDPAVALGRQALIDLNTSGQRF
jgi:N-acetylmuramic acid 6-phosphate etherase